MSTGDPGVDGLLTLAFGALLVGALCAAAGALRLLEKASPRFSHWLDERVGPEPDRYKW